MSSTSYAKTKNNDLRRQVLNRKTKSSDLRELAAEMSSASAFAKRHPRPEPKVARKVGGLVDLESLSVTLGEYLYNSPFAHRFTLGSIFQPSPLLSAPFT